MMRHEEPCTHTHWSPVCWSTGAKLDVEEIHANRFAMVVEGICPGCNMALERLASGLSLCVVCGVQWSIEATGAGEAELTMRFTVRI